MLNVMFFLVAGVTAREWIGPDRQSIRAWMSLGIETFRLGACVGTCTHLMCGVRCLVGMCGVRRFLVSVCDVRLFLFSVCGVRRYLVYVSVM